MKITKSPSYKCLKCIKTFETEIEDFGSPEIVSELRNMGNELQYIWELDTQCEKCKNNINIIIEGYEYPSGFFNYGDTTSEGCLIIKKAELEIE